MGPMRHTVTTRRARKGNWAGLKTESVCRKLLSISMNRNQDNRREQLSARGKNKFNVCESRRQCHSIFQSFAGASVTTTFKQLEVLFPQSNNRLES